MVAAGNLLNPHPTDCIRTGFCRLFQMQLARLLCFINIFFSLELCASIAFVPFYTVHETRLVAAFAACHNWRIRSTVVELARVTVFVGTPAEVRHPRNSFEKHATTVLFKYVWIHNFFYFGVGKPDRALWTCRMGPVGIGDCERNRSQKARCTYGRVVSTG